MKKEKDIDASVEVSEEKKNTGITNVLVLIMAVVFIAMSSLMIFVKEVEIVYLCYAICAAAIIAGICMIVRYFTTDAYRNVNAYGFSGGTLAVTLGVCGLLRAQQLAGAFLIILGIILLLTGIIVLQYSLDLHRMKDVMWSMVFIIAALILVCAVVVILQPMADKFSYDDYIWWMILISGSLSLIINLYTMIRVRLFTKKELKLAQEEEAKRKEASEEEKKLASEAEEKRRQIAEAIEGTDKTEILDDFYSDNVTAKDEGTIVTEGIVEETAEEDNGNGDI